MGLFDLFRGKDPTAAWGARLPAVLEYDMDRHTLAGVRIGKPLDAFSVLGRPEDPKSVRQYRLIYYSQGFEVGLEEGHGLDVEIYFTDDWTHDHHQPKPWAGRFRAKGSEARWTKSTTEQEITNHLGPPKERDVDEDEIRLTYERDRITYEFVLTASGTLESMSVTAEDKA